jgi:DnaJ family protein C protein 9
MDEDPVFQFFPDQDHVDLYAVLGLTSTTSLDNIKKAYRKLALLYHPDKQSGATTTEESSRKFQQVGYAYAVLGDEKRRKRYDETGRTDENDGLGFGPGEGSSWEDYFGAMFEEVTRKRLDELKKEYQGARLI